MRECICSSCKNLKGVANEDGVVEVFECTYGYPSENCSECESGECDEACENYIPDEEPSPIVTVRCSVCGKELTQMCSNEEEGDVKCIECYLNEQR